MSTSAQSERANVYLICLRDEDCSIERGAAKAIAAKADQSAIDDAYTHQGGRCFRCGRERAAEMLASVGFGKR